MPIEPADARTPSIDWFPRAGHRNYPYLLHSRQLPQLGGKLVSIHDWHADIQQRDIWLELGAYSKGHRCIVGDTHLVTLRADREIQHLGSVLVIIDDQDTETLGT